MKIHFKQSIFQTVRLILFVVVTLILLFGSEINITFNYNIAKAKETIFGKVKKVLDTVNEVRTVADYVR